MLLLGGSAVLAAGALPGKENAQVENLVGNGASPQPPIAESPPTELFPPDQDSKPSTRSQICSISDLEILPTTPLERVRHAIASAWQWFWPKNRYQRIFIFAFGVLVVALVVVFRHGEGLPGEAADVLGHFGDTAAQDAERHRLEAKALPEPCPLSLGKLLFRRRFGTPEVGLTVTNKSSQPIEAIEAEVECRDKFNDPVDRHALIYQEQIKAGSTIETGQYALYGSDTAKRFKVTVKRVKLADGTVWSAPKGFEDVNSGTYEFN